MKQANVVAVRAATGSNSAHAKDGNLAVRQRMAELLRRYPDTDEAETAEILTFLRTGDQIDIGLIGGSDELKGKVQQFRADHARHFRLSMRESAVAILLICGLAGAIALLCVR